jgi:hypothetical protein
MKVKIYYKGKIIKTLENVKDLIPYPEGRMLIYDKDKDVCPRNPIAIFNNEYSFVIVNEDKETDLPKFDADLGNIKYPYSYTYE